MDGTSAPIHRHFSVGSEIRTEPKYQVGLSGRRRLSVKQYRKARRFESYIWYQFFPSAPWISQ